MLSWGGNFGKAISATKMSNLNEGLAQYPVYGNQICQNQNSLENKYKQTSMKNDAEN